MKWNSWFRHKKTDMRWLAKSPANRVSRCDRRYTHVVQPHEARLMVDTDEGPVRKKGKGKRHEYLCMACAFNDYGLRPPAPVMENQERMFD